MVKLVALYRKPSDPAAFDKAYFETHVPLVKKIPNLRRVDIARVTGAPHGDILSDRRAEKMDQAYA